MIVSVLKVSKILLTYVDTPSPVSSALYGAQAGLKELAQVTLMIDSKLREIESERWAC